MEPKPIKPCSTCGFNNWWYRKVLGPGWLCNICHPNPNIEEDNEDEKEDEVVKQDEVELIDGKFVVKGKRVETKPPEQESIPKQYSQEVLELRDRIINGNQKLFNAWQQIRELAHNSEEWSRQMDRWQEAQKKLSGLCSKLKLLGYVDCLYIINGKRMKTCMKEPNDFWCQVCSSDYPYWEKELMSL